MALASDLSTAVDRSAPPRRAVESRDPATGEVWRRWPTATTEEVERAVAAARRAQPAWGARSVRERAAIIERFRRALFARRTEIARLISRENGKPPAEALASEVLVALDFARYYRKRAPALLRTERVTPGNIAFWRKRVRIDHEPLGVVAVIAPWNYPFMLAAGQVLAALVSGNAVLLKPSEFTPACGDVLGELLHAAGVPSDVMHVLIGDGSTGAALVASEIDKVFFTGSNATGQKIAMACAERTIPCVLELGGSDPAIVLEDADIATAASGIAWGRFSNAGQTCVAPKRVFVVGDAYEPFVTHIARVVDSLRIGSGADDATDVGPMIRPEQRELLASQVDEAMRGGARVVASLANDGAGGAFYSPMVIADVTPEMRVMREETFGPLLPIVRARDADDAIRLANASPYGLSASVWGRDLRRATDVARRIEAGSVSVNDVISQVGMAEAPHGGVKQSGNGRSHGQAGLLECVRTKTLIIDRLASRRQPWWFGYGAEHARGLDAFVRVWHAPSMRARVGAMWGAVKLLVRPERPL